MHHFKKLFNRLEDRKGHGSNRPKKAQSANHPPHQHKTQADRTSGASVLEPAYQLSIAKAEGSPPQQDLWQSAYDQLDPKEQRILSKASVPARPGGDEEKNSQTKAIIDEVIQTTKEQYEKYQERGLRIQRSTGDDIDLRKLSHKIINAAFTFKEIISTVVGFDPTHHAASAWAVVSLGLTVAKNRSDLRDALFESSEYMADILARHAYIEEKFYHQSKKNAQIGHALVKVYKAILQYTAEVLAIQDSSVGKWMLDSVTEITKQHLTVLKISVKDQEQDLHHCVEREQHLRHNEQAEQLLTQGDQIVRSFQAFTQKFNLPIADGASYDSFDNQHGEKCLPNTRTELRRQVTDWAEASDSKCIFWLNGMAGTGKSTIARTVAQSFDEKGLLGASFFFKQGEADRGNAKRFVSTITRQLMTSNRELAHGISRVTEDDPDLSTKALSQQFDKLLLQPLLKLQSNETKSMVIVIDALDECGKEDDIRVILQLLPKLQESKSIRLQVFLTSRPELPIRHGLKQNDDHQDLILHELPSPVIEHDIRLFLENRFSTIRKNKEIEDWPGNETIEELVKMSSPLFIFAATICRFVEEDYEVPEDRLDAVLQYPALTSSSQMERIYLPVLNHHVSESNGLMKDFQDIVGVIILLAVPLSAKALSEFIDMSGKKTRARLDAFHSVLNVPEDFDTPVRILHLSFREFLVNTTSAFHVDERETHRKILSHCFRIMSSRLKHNICGLSSYGTQRTEIDSQIITEHLPQDLQYSCRYWAYHLKQSEDRSAEGEVLAFLKKHFLHWLEAMSLIDALSDTVGIIDALQSYVTGNTSSEFSEFLHDAKRFILKNVYISNTAPLQLYCSGIAFSPMRSVIRNIFKEDRSRWIHSLPRVENSWSAELQNLEGHSDWVRSVAFSPDGQRVVSGSYDRTVKLWDVTTGSEVQSLEGHLDQVWSVAFSPDGQRVVSGSYDRTVKMWDVTTGSEVQSLEGHSDWVQSVAFSPDGQRVVSGSDDGTVKLWDVTTGSEVQSMEGHSDQVQSVAFSPDGQKPGFQISVEADWVTFRGGKALWLPFDYRQPTCSAIKNDTLSLGYENGRVLILRFCAFGG